jgi:mitochondrial cardiolipin hydrolase
MNTETLSQILLQSLQDHRLSGSERESLVGWTLQNLETPADRALARKITFELFRQSFSDTSLQAKLGWLEEILKVLFPLQSLNSEESPESTAYFSPGNDCLNQINLRLRQCLKRVDICVFTITDNRITRTILETHRRGVAMRIITDNDKLHDAGSDIEEIRAAGIPVCIDRSPFHMHHKFAIFDNSILLNGSYNWTRSAADENEENIIDSTDPKLVARFQHMFDELWNRLC